VAVELLNLSLTSCSYELQMQRVSMLNQIMMASISDFTEELIA